MARTAKGQPGGLATLDATGKVPLTQIPAGAGEITPAEAVEDAPALTAQQAVGANPTGEEYDALLADVTAIHTTLNELLASLRAAGFLAASNGG